MERFGFIHGKLEIKILILFILNRISGPVDIDNLTDLVLCDDGISYFDFVESLAELVETGHVSEENGFYQTTEKGKRNGKTTESSVPFSVRLKAEANTLEVARKLKRNAMIKTRQSRNDTGEYTVHLEMSDGVDNVISMDLLAGSKEHADELERGFQMKAETIYNTIIDIIAKVSRE